MTLTNQKSVNIARVLLLLTVVWALTRLVAWTNANPQVSWDIWEARKLHDYGFANRLGAMVNYHYLPGMLSNPEAFNYVDHPAGAVWIYYAIYPFLGTTGILACCALAGLAGCLLTYLILLRFYDARTALWGGLLYIVAPIAIFYDAEPNFVALGVVFWPLSVYCATDPRLSAVKKAWLLGLIIFVAGQITWFSWMIYPCLIFLTARKEQSFFQQVCRPFSNPIWVGLTIGMFLTAVGFFAQIFGYSGDLDGAFDYALRRVRPKEESLTRAVMMKTVLIKFFLLIGPALFLGGIAGLIVTLKRWGKDRLAVLAVIGLACNVVAIAVLTNFYYTEQNGHRFMLFPACVLTATLLWQITYRWLKPLLVVLSLCGLFYAEVRTLIPVSSQASNVFSEKLAAKFDPYALIYTNLGKRHAPFPSWEPDPSWNVSLSSDRHIYLEANTLKGLAEHLTAFRSQSKQPPVFYLVDPSQSLDDGLRAYLEKNGKRLDDWALEFPFEKPNAGTQLRSLYWRLAKSRYALKANENTNSATQLTFQVYELPAKWPEGE